MRKQTGVKALLLFGILGVPVVHGAPRSATAKAKNLAILTENAFNSLVLDSDAEDIDIQQDVRAALRPGASPNVRDAYGDTLLIQAVENNRLSIVPLLIQKGADINLPDTRLGDTPLIRASYINDITANSVKPMTSMVRLLLQKRADPNKKNKAGETALTLASSCGHSEIVAALLKAGADFRLRNKYGQTPLQIASKPVIKGSVQVGGSLAEITSDEPTQAAKAIQEHEKLMKQLANTEEQRIRKGRAEIQRLLRAAENKKRRPKK